MNGGKAVYISLGPPDYKIDWNLVKDKITSKTKLIIINTPHNPSGVLWQQDDLNYLFDIIKDQKIFVITDEVL